MKHITRVEIENIRGIRHMVIDLSAITIIQGRNGSGKSSVIEAIRLAFTGGYDPLAVHKDADIGKVTVTGDDESTITRTIDKTRRTSRVDVKSAAGEVISAPQSYIDRLSSAFSYDPLALLRCTPKERFKYLKESLAVEVKIDELTAIARAHFVDEDVVYGSWDAKASGLDQIAKVRKAAYDRRTEINRKGKNIEGAIATMRLSVPSLNADGAGWRDAEAQLSQQLSTAKSLRAAAIQQANDEGAAATEAINAWEREELAKIRAEASKRRETITHTHAAALAQVQGEHDPGIGDLTARHAEARQQLSDYDKAIGAREAIEKLEKELEGQRTLGDKLTFVIEDIDKLEKSKLATSPAPGVELRDGEIYIDGIAFDGVNTQRKYEVAIQIGAANAGDLRSMICDEIEHWDSENLAMLKQAAKDSGFQIIAAAVEDTPLEVHAA